MKKLNLLKHISSVIFLLFILVLAVLLVALPKAEKSENEKRELADFPSVTFTSIAEGDFSSGLDTFFADHFPFRDFFVGVNAYWELFTGRNGASGVYKGSDGYLIAEPAAFDAARTKTNVERFAEFSEIVDLPATLMVVPNLGYMMEDKLPSQHKTYHDAEIFSLASDHAGKMNFVDLRAAFMGAKDSTQLYYKTDHHLTSAGSYLMYQRFCSAMGVEPKAFALSETFSGFYGTAYSHSGLWFSKPDQLEIWATENPGSYFVTIDDGLQVKTAESLYFREHLSEMDQYPVFLDGNHSLVTIENKNCQNGKRLLLVKDSFAHCFATFAAEDYEQICMVDLRYYRDSVKTLVEEQNLTEILYLYGAENLSTSTDTAWLIPLE